MTGAVVNACVGRAALQLSVIIHIFPTLLVARAVVCAHQSHLNNVLTPAQAILKACVTVHQQGGTCLLPVDADRSSLLTLFEEFISVVFWQGSVVVVQRTRWWGPCAGSCCPRMRMALHRQSRAPKLGRGFFSCAAGLGESHARMPARLCFSLGMG